MTNKTSVFKAQGNNKIKMKITKPLYIFVSIHIFTFYNTKSNVSIQP